MINADNISFYYEASEYIVKNFTYNFKEKKSYVIVGENGKGKTTLLRLLLGLLSPSKGTVEIDNNAVISYLPDYNGLYENLSLIDNVRFRLGIYNKSLEDVKDLFNIIVNRLDLKKYVDDDVRNMSLGTKKKVGLLCALIIEPDILVMDEPTGGLDLASRRQLIKTLKEYGKDMLIITVTHDESYIDNMNSEKILV